MSKRLCIYTRISTQTLFVLFKRIYAFAPRAMKAHLGGSRLFIIKYLYYRMVKLEQKQFRKQLDHQSLHTAKRPDLLIYDCT